MKTNVIFPLMLCCIARWSAAEIVELSTQEDAMSLDSQANLETDAAANIMHPGKRSNTGILKQVTFLSDENRRLKTEVEDLKSALYNQSAEAVAEKRKLVEIEIASLEAKQKTAAAEATLMLEKAKVAQATYQQIELEKRAAVEATEAARRTIEERRIAAEKEAETLEFKRFLAESSERQAIADTEVAKLRLQQLEIEERVALAKQLESINHRMATEAELAMAVNGAEVQREIRLLEEAKVRSIEAQVKLKLAEDEVHARETERRLDLERKLRDEDTIRRRQEMQLSDELARTREIEAASNELQRQGALQEMQAKQELELAIAKAEQERVTAQQRVQWEADARIREEKETEDIKQRAAEAAARADAEKLNAAIAQVGSILAEGSRAFFAEYLSLTIAATVSLVAAYFALREATIAIRKQVLRMLGTPSLVRDTSRKSGLASMASLLCCRSCRRATPIGLDELARGIVLPDEILNRVLSLTKATRNARTNMAPLRHVMFYGPPGTGKTLVAQQIARFCGLDYAIMSGGDIAPLGSHAISELNDLFAWAHSSKEGLVLFIDEAEAFLGSRNKANLSENMRNVLSTLLHHTGAQSQKLMLILATNRPEDLDSAVTDRMDDSICFPSPPTQQRIALGRLYFHKFISSRSQMAAEASATQPIVHSDKPLIQKAVWCCARPPAPMIRVTSDVTLVTLDTLMAQAQSMSGRQIAKLMLTVQASVYGSDVMPPTLTADVLQHVVQIELRKLAAGAERNVEEPTRSAAVYSARKSPSTLLGAADPRYRGDPDGEGNPAVVESLNGFDVEASKARPGARKK